MAIVSFANLDETFDVTAFLVTYSGASTYVRTPSNFSWTTATLVNDVDFDGVGISYSGNTPIAGIITQFRLDLGDDSEASPELRITGLNLNAGLLGGLDFASPSVAQNLVWDNVLAGNDTISLVANGASFGVTFAGDGRYAIGLDYFNAGDDIITGSVGVGTAGKVAISGDFFLVDSSTHVSGGDDSMTVTLTGGRWASGDADQVFGTLFGGNDVITATTSAINQVVFGDANTVGSTGTLIGGDDIITVTANGSVRGDASLVDTSSGLFAGGNDTIYGGDGANSLVGDALSISSFNGVSAAGGADKIYGMAGDDVIYGDFSLVNGTSFGGNDTLFGGAGNDTIYGDDPSDTPGYVYGGNDFLRGDAGNDILDGGDGFDTASWQYGTGATINVATGSALDGEGGTDTFSNIEQFIGSGFYRDVFTDGAGIQYFAGLGGNDYVIDNGGGADVFNGGDGFDTVSFYNRGATSVNLRANTAITGSVTTTIVGFEEVYGSSTGGDTLVGDNGNNTFWGFGGADYLRGAEGLDTLNGGLGSDIFAFNAADLQAGIWDVISDFHEVANSDFDKLYFNGVARNQLVHGEANGGLYVSTVALGGTGGVFLAGFTWAQLQDQLLFT